MTNETTQTKSTGKNEKSNQPKSNTKYEIQHYTLCEGWTNPWIINKDGKDIPYIFDTEVEAQAELYEFLAETANEIKSGERKPHEGFTHEEFRIVPLESLPESCL